jgi:hypothetical protein
VKRIVAAILILSCLISFASPVPAAEEKSKSQAVEDELEKPSESSGSEAGQVATQGLLELFAQFFLAGLMTTVGESPGDMYRQLKEQESPALPTIRIEPSYQYVFDGVHGFSGKAEAGYLLFGVSGEYLRYFEKGATPDLTIASGHFLLRTMLGEMLGVDLALGAKALWGQDRHTGFDLGIPFHLFFGKHFIFDVLPSWASIRGHDVYDLDAGLAFKYKLVGIRAAYRAIFVGDTTLHGPKVGLFFQW